MAEVSLALREPELGSTVPTGSAWQRWRPPICRALRARPLQACGFISHEGLPWYVKLFAMFVRWCWAFIYLSIYLVYILREERIHRKKRIDLPIIGIGIGIGYWYYGSLVLIILG
ncbi:hypothetical protein F4778DRAFT_221761 [Xylariomycetidae sp. FL2044]|nr:hypothetical protein F4778DRAFT_221761 [Xylariomycetidae sp. FL2044]